MRTLYVDRRDTALDVDGGAMVLHLACGRRQSVPLGGLEKLVLRGPATLSTRLLATLHERDVGLVLLAGRHARPSAQLVGWPHADARARIAQAQLLARPELRAGLARLVVRSKIEAQARLLAELRDKSCGDRRHLLTAL